MNIVLYHGICTDGFTSALLMHLYFRATGQMYEMRPVNYKEPLPTGLDGKHVYIVDFCYPPEVIRDFAKVAKSITVLDHHLTAAQDFDGYGEKKYTVGECPVHIQIYEEHSGASLTFKYISELEISSNSFVFLTNKRLQRLVTAVRDYDLWHHDGMDAKIFHELLQMIPRKIGAWEDMFLHITDADFDKWMEKSVHYFDSSEALATSISASHQMIHICGYVVPVINSPQVFADRVCEQLYQDHPFAISFIVNSEHLYCSLRSKRGYGANVAEIAKMFGGGGHTNSAGFKIHPCNLPKLLSGKLSPKPCLMERIIDSVIQTLEYIRFFSCK